MSGTPTTFFTIPTLTDEDRDVIIDLDRTPAMEGDLVIVIDVKNTVLDRDGLIVLRPPRGAKVYRGAAHKDGSWGPLN